MKASWAPQRLLLFAALASLVVVALDPAVRYVLIRLDDTFLPLLPFVAVANEANLPTWWNTTVLILLAASFAACGALAEALSAGQRRGWYAATVVVAALSLDELTSLHERLGPMTLALLESRGSSFPTYAWLLPGTAVALVGLILGFLWARTLPRLVRAYVFGGLMLFVAGAIGLEATAGLLKKDHRQAYYLATLAEESCEMLGALLAMGGPLHLLRRTGGAVRAGPSVADDQKSGQGHGLGRLS